MAQTSTLAVAVIVLAVIAGACAAGVGIYRARYDAAREEGYRTLAEHSAENTRATAEELRGLRTELGDVRQRLAALETLLSQIG